MEFFEDVWFYKLQIFPILISIGILESFSLFRYHSKLPYAPLYFLMPPLRSINNYYYEFVYLHEKTISKKKLVQGAVIALELYGVIFPAITGLIFAFVFNEIIFKQALIAIVFFKSLMIYKSIKNYNLMTNSSLVKKSIIAVLYFIYLAIVSYMIYKVYYWAHPYTLNKQWFKFSLELFNFVFWKILIEGIIIGGLGFSVFLLPILEPEHLDEQPDSIKALP